MTQSTHDGHAAHSLHGGVIPATCHGRRVGRRQVDARECAAVEGQRHLPVDLVHDPLPRPGEQDGQHYHFTTVEDFARHAAHEFLESAEVHGNYYGTSRVWIEEQMKNGHDVLLEIDWQARCR